MYFSKLMQGFFNPDRRALHEAAGNWPADAVAISDADYAQLLAAPKLGKVIDWSGAAPAAADPLPVAPAIPASVSPAQARLALLGAGKLAQVEAIVAAADPATQIAWNNASVIERSSPTVAALSAALGLDGAQLDALFATAAGIRV